MDYHKPVDYNYIMATVVFADEAPPVGLRHFAESVDSASFVDLPYYYLP